MSKTTLREVAYDGDCVIIGSKVYREVGRQESGGVCPECRNPVKDCWGCKVGTISSRSLESEGTRDCDCCDEFHQCGRSEGVIVQIVRAYREGWPGDSHIMLHRPLPDDFPLGTYRLKCIEGTEE